MRSPSAVASWFLVLVLVQAGHSVEEYVFRLWQVLPPARYVSNALGLNPAIGFLIANTALVLFGLWCWLRPVREGWRWSAPILWSWALGESANGIVHIALAIGAGGYFPGLYTTPLLIAAGGRLAYALRARTVAKPS